MTAQENLQPDIRDYSAYSRSTDTFGRVMCGTRNHHFVIDGPVANGCPGEEVTPGELFLSAVAACGAELLQVIARQQEIPLQAVMTTIKGVQDRSNPARQDYSVFNSVRMEFELSGVSEEQGASLVEAFKRR
jgi:uncharacterized OsmC-like protein